MQTKFQDSEKVEKRSVSFSPGSLYDWAKNWGASQTPKQSASAVVCSALREFRDRVDPTANEGATAQLAALADINERHGAEATAKILKFMARTPSRKLAQIIPLPTTSGTTPPAA